VKSSPSDEAHTQGKYLADMLESAVAIQQYMQDVSFEEFWDDALKRDAATYRINIIGEAAKHITRATAKALPEIPFELIRGMRNRIAHEYDHIDYRKVWGVTQDHIGPLVAALKKHFLAHPPPPLLKTEIERVRAHPKEAIQKASESNSDPLPESNRGKSHEQGH
jgi:uncharacterized protein with HEPN domain